MFTPIILALKQILIESRDKAIPSNIASFISISFELSISEHIGPFTMLIIIIKIPIQDNKAEPSILTKLFGINDVIICPIIIEVPLINILEINSDNIEKSFIFVFLIP